MNKQQHFSEKLKNLPCEFSIFVSTPSFHGTIGSGNIQVNLNDVGGIRFSGNGFDPHIFYSSIEKVLLREDIENNLDYPEETICVLILNDGTEFQIST